MPHDNTRVLVAAVNSHLVYCTVVGVATLLDWDEFLDNVWLPIRPVLHGSHEQSDASTTRVEDIVWIECRARVSLIPGIKIDYTVDEADFQLFESQAVPAECTRFSLALIFRRDKIWHLFFWDEYLEEIR